MARAKQPIATTFFIFYTIIIAVVSLLYPPLLLNAFGPIGLYYLVQLVFVSKQHWRVIGYWSSYFNKLRYWQHVQWSSFASLPVGSFYFG